MTISLLTIVQLALTAAGLSVVIAVGVVTWRARVRLKGRDTAPLLRPPAWQPRADPFSEYAFDLVPVNSNVRVRVDVNEADPAVLARAFASFSAGREVHAVPPPDDQLWSVLLNISGTIEPAGSLPPGYEHPVNEAFTRRGSIPVEMWSIDAAYTLDLLTGRTT